MKSFASTWWCDCGAKAADESRTADCTARSGRLAAPTRCRKKRELVVNSVGRGSFHPPRAGSSTRFGRSRGCLCRCGLDTMRHLCRDFGGRAADRPPELKDTVFAVDDKPRAHWSAKRPL